MWHALHVVVMHVVIRWCVLWTVNAIFGIPMYSTGVGVCVRLLWSGFPKVLDMGTRGDGDRQGCIDSDGAYPGVR